MRTSLAALALLPALAAASQAANLDVTASYRMKALSYKNLDLNEASPNRKSFIANDARLGVAVKRISLEGAGEDSSMDLAIVLHALGATGSSTTLKGPPSAASPGAIPPRTSPPSSRTPTSG